MSTRRALVIEVRFPGGQFHGTRRTDRVRSTGNSDVTEWPPSPFRLFQALVAGSCGGRWVAEQVEARDSALAWLESLDAPIVVVPIARALSPVTYYVPNNDLDTVAGDPSRISEIRVAKRLSGSVMNPEEPVVYIWAFDDPAPHADLLFKIADRLHTLGHGIDAAFATASLITGSQLQKRLDAHRGIIQRPGSVDDATAATPCPAPGSLVSLKRRHEGLQQRFRHVADGKKSVIEFRQPPRAHMRMVGYGSAPRRLLFELRDALRSTDFRPTPHTRAAALVKVVRDLAFDRLANALPERRVALDRAIVGRGDPAPDQRSRVRFIPLPSIGLVHTSPSIRRLMVELPAGASLTPAELSWALTGRVFGGQADGDGVLGGQTLLAPVNMPVSDDAMAARYLRTASLWRSVTPVVLPISHLTAAADGSQRFGQLEGAARAVAQALRHAQIEARVVSVVLQREPFRRRGRHTAHHDCDRFGTARLHHLELQLDRAVEGPLLLGDGRWLGLGLMEPVKQSPAEWHLFRIEGQGPAISRGCEVSRALRRAVMARVQAELGAGRPLPLFFSGHQADGMPAAGEHHQHLSYLADDGDGDGRIDRLAVVAPELPPTASPGEQLERRQRLTTLGNAVRGLSLLRAGPAGVFELRVAQWDGHDPVFGVGRGWISRTPYRPTRQPKQRVEEALRDDLRRECERRCLPAPQTIEVLDIVTGVRGRISAHVRLHFATVVAGPLLLGDDAHFGRSLFQLDDSLSLRSVETAITP